MDKKVLVFFPHPLKQRHGGPYSMLYHLKQGLGADLRGIHFLSDLIKFDENNDSVSGRSSLLKRLLASLLPQRIINNRRVTKWMSEVSLPPVIPLTPAAVQQFPILHFHETIDLWRFRKLLAGYSGQIVLTSHTPKPYHLELLEDVLMLSKDVISPAVYKKLEAIDLFAYQKADELIFPCSEATAPYLQCWPAFKTIIDVKPVHIVTTGVVPSVFLQERISIREQLNIPDDAFVVTFVGRQLPVKGYDLLQAAAAQLLPYFSDLFFIIVGKKNAVSFHHPQWIETGWTDDPFSYVNAGDLHIVPNRFTNFDLNVLEVLSLGKPLLVSDSGGNKFFKRFQSPAIFYHEPTVESLAQELKHCYQLRYELPLKAHANKEIYATHFTAERFANDQLAFYKSLG